MNTQQILSRAADIVEQGWTQGAYAVDSKGTKSYVTAPEACRFCTMGAIKKAAGDNDVSYTEAVNHLSKHEGIANIAIWNDNPSRTQGQVVAALRNAAK